MSRFSIASFAGPLLAVLPLLAACTTEATDTDPASASLGLTTPTVTALTISAYAGYMAAPPLESCLYKNDGSFTVDFVARTVKGHGCAGGMRRISVDRALTEEESTSIKAALSQVQVVPSDELCFADGPTEILTVKHGARELRYTNPYDACSGEVQAAKGLENMLATLQKLAKDTEHTLQGSLASVMAVGGETTGRIIQSEGGTFDLEFESGSPLASEFAEGRKAVLVGVREDRPGVEIPVRQIIKVTKLLVCPPSGTVLNCENNPSKYCSEGNLDWVWDQCDGVTFLD